MMPSVPRCVAFALMAALLASCARPGTPNRLTGQVETEGGLIDYDYAFELRRPPGSWQLLAQPRVRKIVPDAVAGMLNAPLYGTVIAERAVGVELEAFADFVYEAMPLENKRLVSRSKGSFQGRDAIRLETVGVSRGLRFRYAYLITQNREYTYQILAWTIDRDSGRTPDLGYMEEAFSFRSGPVVGRSSIGGSTDAHGVGWRLRDATFESAAFGLSVRPNDGWRLVVGTELRELNPDAEVGLAHAGTESYAVLLTEPAEGRQAGKFEQVMRENLRARLGGLAPIDEFEVPVAGRARSFEEYHANVGIDIRYLHAAWVEDGLAHQVISWHLPANSARARAVLPAGLAGIEMLGAGEQRRLTDELAALPDVDDSVGRHHSLRDGVYRDFERGYEWRKPEGGFWQASVGQTARDQNSDAAVMFSEKRSGLFGQIIVEPRNDLEGATYHDAVIRNMRMALARSEVSVPEDFGGAGAAGRQSTLRGVMDGLDVTWRVTTFVWNREAAQLLIWASSDNFDRYAGDVRSAVESFRVHAGGLPETVAKGGRYADHRLGFALALPSGSEAPVDITPSEIRPLATLLSVAGQGQGEFLVMAMNMPTSEMDESDLLELMTGQMGKLAPGLSRSVEAVVTKSSFHGLPSTIHTWELDGERVVIEVSRRARTFFAFLGHAGAGQGLLDSSIVELID